MNHCENSRFDDIKKCVSWFDYIWNFYCVQFNAQYFDDRKFHCVRFRNDFIKRNYDLRWRFCLRQNLYDCENLLDYMTKKNYWYRWYCWNELNVDKHYFRNQIEFDACFQIEQTKSWYNKQRIWRVATIKKMSWITQSISYTYFCFVV